MSVWRWLRADLARRREAVQLVRGALDSLPPDRQEEAARAAVRYLITGRSHHLDQLGPPAAPLGADGEPVCICTVSQRCSLHADGGGPG